MRASDENLGHFTSSRSMSVLTTLRRSFVHVHTSFDKKSLQIEYKEPRKLWSVEFSTISIRKKKMLLKKMRLT